MAKPFCYFDTTISNKAADSSDRPKTIKLTDKDHTDCYLQMNASYVRNNYLYRATSSHKNRLYAKARKDNYDNGRLHPTKIGFMPRLGKTITTTEIIHLGIIYF